MMIDFCQPNAVYATYSDDSDNNHSGSVATPDEGRGQTKRSKSRKPHAMRSLRKSFSRSFTKAIGKSEESFQTSKTSLASSLSSQTSVQLQEELLNAQVGSDVANYLEKCLSTEVNVLNKDKFEAIPEFHKSELTIAHHLGKGVYSDVFEVGVVVPVHEHLKVGTFGLDPKASANVKGKKAAADGGRRPSRRASRRSSLHSSTVTSKSHTRPANCEERTVVYAMKCLRPYIRSDPDQFTIGAEDLVHETAMLASINHPNVIKVYGRAAGKLDEAFMTNDGYFILLDKLSCTLEDCIENWKLNGVTMGGQIDVAHSISSAIAYLHSKNIVFRDLKPANVGFDAQGVVKLFDFGFAVGVPDEGQGLLYDRCGTIRYMAPEVGLNKGYGIEVDTYSFGVLLWEIIALAKPFQFIQSAEKFEQKVFIEELRPEIDYSWPQEIQSVMLNCWAADPSMRPSMQHVWSVLAAMKSSSQTRRRERHHSVRHLSMTLGDEDF